MSNDTLPVTQWTLPRPPLFRYCTCSLTHVSDAWPDNGEGVWQIIGFHDMDLASEYWELRRIMPAEPGGPSGEVIKVNRIVHDIGGLMIWVRDFHDPLYCKQ